MKIRHAAIAMYLLENSVPESHVRVEKPFEGHGKVLTGQSPLDVHSGLSRAPGLTEKLAAEPFSPRRSGALAN